MKNSTIAYFAFFIVVLLSMRTILFLDVNTIPGHNWDWGFPNINILFNKINILSNSAWWDYNLGIPLNLMESQVIPNNAISFISYLFGIKIAILSLFTIIFSVSFLSFKKLLDNLIKEDRINYIASFLYSFSPFLFNDIIGGSWYFWVSYAFAPLMMLNILKYVDIKSIKHLIGFLLSAIFTLLSIQNFILIEVIIVLFLTANILTKKQEIRKTIFRYLFAHTVLIFVNFYWLLPFADSFLGFYGHINSPSATGAFKAVENSKQTILNIFLLTGYLDRNMYFYALPDFIIPVYIFAVLMFWALILIPVTWKNKVLNYEANTWLFILLLLIIIIKGGNPPLSNFTMWFYNIFPIMILYRSPQHMMFAAAFIIPVLVAYSLNYLYTNLKFKKTILYISIFCILIWTSGWWYNGDLGHEILKNKQKDFIDFYSLSPGLKEIYERNEYSLLNHRILFLPAVFSPQYIKTEYQNKAQGGQPEYLYLKNPTFTSESIPFANEIDISLCKNDEYNYINYLSLFSIKDIVLRYDIYPIHTESRFCWDNGPVKNKLDNSGNLTKFLEEKYEIGYTIKSEYYLPQIYTPTTITQVRNSNVTSENNNVNNVTILLKVVSQPDYDIRNGIYFKELNKSFYNAVITKKDIGSEIELKIYENKDTPVLEILKINPTKYRIRVHQAKNDFPVIFSASFNEGWKNYVSDFTSSQISRTNNKNEAELINNYEVIKGNEENQAKKEEIVDLIQKGYISTLGEGKDILFRGEKYKVNFISQDFEGTIQNDNLPKGMFWETWLPGKLLVINSSYYLLKNGPNKKVVQLPDESHQMVNGYANSWFINIDEIKNTGKYTQNLDGSIDFELVIEYWPQRLFYIGLIISVLTFFVCVGFLIWDLMRNEKTVNNLILKNSEI